MQNYIYNIYLNNDNTTLEQRKCCVDSVCYIIR
jgi:hypothetical protein